MPNNVFYGTEKPYDGGVIDNPAEQEKLDSLEPQQIITEKEVEEAANILAKYKDGKSNLENRVVEDEQWWKLRHWDVIRKKSNEPQPEPSSAWLFNAILNKHADAMDNYPEPVVLPREKSDEESAKTLCSILPVVMEYNDFQQTYDANWWEKLKHGTAVYGVFWDTEKDNGLGDIAIRPVDLLKIFWEPGIQDIQDSRNLFIVDLVDRDIMDEMYPEYAGRFNGNAIDVREYIYDESIDNSDKAVVVDWYYKKKVGTKTVLHYVKFCGNCVLYASENQPEYREVGYYEHGLYPVIFDVMFPEKSMPTGMGMISICKDPQLYIDKLSANIMESSMMGTKKRFFISNNTAINEDEFKDWNNPLVHVEGELGEERLREIVVQPPSAIYENILQMKIDEMKDTAANKDVNSGSSGSITAASAISALQEAGNKVSRDLLNHSYDAYRQIVLICIELMRQFYDEARSFRVTGQMPGQYQFVDMSNLYLREQPNGYDSMGNELFRKPIFDLKIKAQKKNPFSRMEENERAKELYSLGFFNPERAQEALGAIQMMDFEGIDKVREQISQGQTLLNMVQQMSAQLQQMSAMLGIATGMDQTDNGSVSNAPAASQQNPQGAATDKVASGAMKAQTPMTSYGQRLAKRSAPNMNAGSPKDLAK